MSAFKISGSLIKHWDTPKVFLSKRNFFGAAHNHTGGALRIWAACSSCFSSEYWIICIMWNNSSEELGRHSAQNSLMDGAVVLDLRGSSLSVSPAWFRGQLWTAPQIFSSLAQFYQREIFFQYKKISRSHLTAPTRWSRMHLHTDSTCAAFPFPFSSH